MGTKTFHYGSFLPEDGHELGEGVYRFMIQNEQGKEDLKCGLPVYVKEIGSGILTRCTKTGDLIDTANKNTSLTEIYDKAGPAGKVVYECLSDGKFYEDGLGFIEDVYRFIIKNKKCSKSSASKKKRFSPDGELCYALYDLPNKRYIECSEQELGERRLWADFALHAKAMQQRNKAIVEALQERKAADVQLDTEDADSQSKELQREASSDENPHRTLRRQRSNGGS